MSLRNSTLQTIDTYVQCIARFKRFFNSSPEHLSPEDVRAYLVHLVQERRASLSYDKQTRSAPRFLHRASLGPNDVPDAIPQIPETRRIELPPFN